MEESPCGGNRKGKIVLGVHGEPEKVSEVEAWRMVERKEGAEDWQVRGKAGEGAWCFVVVQSLSPVQIFAISWTATPGPLVLHHLLEFAQTHIHWVSDIIQPSHPLPPSSPPAFNLSQKTGSFPMSWLFESGDQSIGPSTSACKGWLGVVEECQRGALIVRILLWIDLYESPRP